MIRIEDIASNAKLRTSPVIKDSAVAKDNRDYGTIALDSLKKSKIPDGFFSSPNLVTPDYPVSKDSDEIEEVHQDSEAGKNGISQPSSV